MNFTPTEALVFERDLIKKGYKKTYRSFENSDYVFWKGFEKEYDEFDDEIVGYQIGLTFYDFTRYHHNSDLRPISMGYHFILGNNSKVNRMNITISDDKMTVEKFEDFCKDFYNIWIKTNSEIMQDAYV
jgi:hypothetical protein